MRSPERPSPRVAARRLRHCADGLMLGLCLAACGADLDVLRHPDASASEDASSAPDATSDDDATIAEDATRPSRLTRRPLLGALPIENRWTDPMMELQTEHWALDVIDGTATPFERFDRMRREVHPDVPTGAPVLHVRKGRDGRSSLITEGVAIGGRLDARVWIGRRIDFAGDAPEVMLLGTSTSGAPLAASLVTTSTVVARTSGVEWTRFEGRWDALPIGQVILRVEDPVIAAELFVSGPELVDATLRASGGPRARPRDVNRALIAKHRARLRFR